MQTRKFAFGLALYLAAVSIVGFLARDAFAQLISLSTRGFVGTGADVLIGGFIIGGTTPKTLLIRGRGPSMAGAPFFVPGTLPDPFLRLFSGPIVLAENDNWADTQSNLIMLTGLDPCQPNPGQVVSPVNCALESAILITLNPGAYTVHLSGVVRDTGPFADDSLTVGTGVALLEIF